ncbi:hypothetical protein BU15DRAFT_82909 [Melanogaster broomeanus]|nr:hypothetical protein BU15DRAFT_82909 [Melanogaster broomeanus]
MAAAAVSLSCPLRRSSRIAHNHTHSSPPLHHSHKLKQQQHPRYHTRPPPDPEPDQDSSSSDPENELTPRALRALKRRRLALDVDGLPLPTRHRPRKRRKENILQTRGDDPRLSQLPIKDATERPKRPSSPTLSPLALKRAHIGDNQRSTATGDNVPQLPSTPSMSIPEQTMALSSHPGLSISIPSPLVTDDKRPLSASCHEPFPAAPNDEPSILSPKDNDPRSPLVQITKDLVLSIPLPSLFVDSVMAPPASPVHTLTPPEPLTPLSPLTPTPESSPSLPGHDRQAPLPSPPHDSLPPSVTLESVPMQRSPVPDSPSTHDTSHQPLALDSTPSPPRSTSSPPLPLDPALDTLIPFDGIPPPFDPEMSLHLAPSRSPPSDPPQHEGLEQEQFPPFQQPQLYVPPHPVFVRDREINIWKLACQERVDCLCVCSSVIQFFRVLLSEHAILRRYGSDYIKALVESEACFLSKEIRSPSTSPSSDPADSGFNPSTPTTPSQTKFRLYTPASYTHTSNSWGSGPGAVSDGKAFPVEDGDPGWPMDDTDWGDGDVDMEDEDEDDYEDDDDLAEVDAEDEGELNLALDSSMDVDGVNEKTTQMQVNGKESAPSSEPTVACEVSTPSPPSCATVSHPESPASLSTTPIRSSYTPPPPSTPLQRPNLPLLSSLHVPLLSEPPRAFMGRGTPPDRRRLVEWSGFGRFGSNRLGMGPPLYLSPVPQRHLNADLGISPMSVDAPMHHMHQHQGEWTTFLYAMLESDGVGVGMNVGGTSQGSEPGWYELGLGSVTTPASDLGIPLSHTHTHSPSIPMSHAHTPVSAAEHVADDVNSSSTLRVMYGFLPPLSTFNLALAVTPLLLWIAYLMETPSARCSVPFPVSFASSFDAAADAWNY